ncbi:hypothetical protein SISSUDRAFT_958338, partial [Sistotremastrum suecicum HHB10207 ss-3]
MLDGTNWVTWKRRMSAVLAELDLLKYCNGTHPIPVPAVLTAPTPAENTALRAWEAGNQKTITRLELCLGEIEGGNLLNRETAEIMWRKLCEIHEAHGPLGI